MCAPPPAAQKHLPAAFYKVAQAILAAMTHEKHCAPPRANRVASSPHQGSPKLLAPVRRRGLFFRRPSTPVPRWPIYETVSLQEH